MKTIVEAKMDNSTEMENQRECYREEAYELLGTLESALMELEESPGDGGLVDRVFRAMHTIKGSGAMFGFDDIACFTHEIETIYDLVREGKIKAGKLLVGLTLSACDQIRRMVDGEGKESEEQARILQGFSLIIKESIPVKDTETSPTPSDNGAAGVLPQPGGDACGESGHGKMVRIRFKPERGLFSTGTNPLGLLDELRSLGECSITALTGDMPALDEMDPESCYMGWDIVLTTEKGMDVVRDVFIFVEDHCDLEIEEIDWQADDGDKRLGEILVERGDLAPDALEEILERQAPIGEMLQRDGLAEKSVIESALAQQRQTRSAMKESRERKTVSSIRVPADKLDVLVALVGELVTVQATLSRKAAGQGDGEWLSISEKVERLTTELRDHTMGIRMLPIGTTFTKFKRLARDLSNDLGKAVHLITEGGDTELDKTVIERLNDPLVHIIRNSIDHGIEGPEEREAAGKAPQGNVTLSATHSGSHVLVRISDDGKGLDPEMIRARAVARGVIAPEEELTLKEIFALIFSPGFSTAEKVTGVSGRGVGMDVVKRGVEKLRGSIDVESEIGRGTTVTLKLPLTLAIIDGLLVEIGDTAFVMPLSAVEECKELTREDLDRANGRNLLSIRDEIVPFVPLREMFELGGSRPAIEQIVITEVDGVRLGFVVDEIIGEHQTVIKNLGNTYRDAKGFSGATILADGTVALILDVGGLSEMAREEEQLR